MLRSESTTSLQSKETGLGHVVVPVETNTGEEDPATAAGSTGLAHRTLALVKLLGAETRGIERVMPEDRAGNGFFSTFCLFISANDA